MYYTSTHMVYALTIDSTNFAPAKFASIANLLNVILPTVTIVIALAALVYMLYGTFLWITGGDNPEQIKKAQMTITFAIIGLFIVVFSFFVVKLIGYVLNIQSSVPL